MFSDILGCFVAFSGTVMDFELFCKVSEGSVRTFSSYLELSGIHETP